MVDHTVENGPSTHRRKATDGFSGQRFYKTPADYEALASARGFVWLGSEVPNNRTKTGWLCGQGHRWEARYTNIQQGSGCPYCANRSHRTPADYEALALKRGVVWLGPEVPNNRTKTGWLCGQGHRWEAKYSDLRQGSGCPYCANRSHRTPADYEALAEARGFVWLGPPVSNSNAKTGWLCGRGHRWETRYKNIQQGSGCPYCAGTIRKTSADYEALASARGFVWLGPEVPNNNTKTGWLCGRGHRWEARYTNIRQGKGCPHCASSHRVHRTSGDYEALALKRGFVWLGPEVPNDDAKTGWLCGQGHRWEAKYRNIRQGSGCPYCVNRVRKTPADYEALAEARGFVWLGPPVSNSNAKTGWLCGRGHRWETRYKNIQQGSGCLYCVNRSHRTPADYEALALKRGFVWLGPEVPNNNTKTGWLCGQGHRWEAKYSDLKQGNGCPHCAGTIRKTPADYEALAEARGFIWLGPEVPNNNTKTGWLCGQGHRWQTKYSALQQGKGCPHCARAKQRGSIRNFITPADYLTLAAERGFTWLGPEVSTVIEKTWWKCGLGHRWAACYGSLQQGRGCPYCAGVAPKTPKDYEVLARKRGFAWLGPEVPSTNTTTTWQCDQGHQWQAPYSSIRRGAGCPYCAGTIRKTLADYEALAKKRGFVWVEPEVPTNTLATTTWQCDRGHQWQAAYSNIQRGGGCPYCAGTIRKTPADYEALAKKWGFVWVGPEVPNTATTTTWQCDRGHRWQARYGPIQRGGGCPYCAGTIRKTPADYKTLAEKRGFIWLGPEVPNTGTITTWQCAQGHQWQTCYDKIRQGSGCPYCARARRSR